MKIMSRSTALLGPISLALCSVCAVPAHAQATRTWVSGVGDDVNPCSRTAPCKTFAGAISKTAAGGEINCLDPAGFGAVTINKALTISCPYTEGGVLAGGNGIVVNAGATDAVYLRGLDIFGVNPPTNGVRFIAGASLTIEDCTIRRFNAANSEGISFQPTGASTLTVQNCTIAENGNGSTGGGILVQPTGTGSARVVLTNVRVLNNGGTGIRLSSQSTTNPQGAQGRIDHAEVSSNGQGIIMVSSGATANAISLIENSAVSNNGGFGIQSDGAAARARVANTTITLNGTGVNAITGADILSFGNNRLVGNTSDGTFSSTIGPQ